MKKEYVETIQFVIDRISSTTILTNYVKKDS